jgi:imidazolonepropionase-like amidohydrolase
MDRPIERPGNRGWRTHRDTIRLAVVVVGSVTAVASLVPLGLFLFMPRSAGSGGTPGEVPFEPTTATAPAPKVMFQGAEIVDAANGAVLPARDVLVEDGRITVVRPGLDVPAGALVVPAHGRYLMPGLIDTHVHLDDDRDLLLFVAAGVTTVQSLGGSAVRNRARAAAVAAGTLAGPTVVSCDDVIRGTASVAEATSRVDEALERGAACLKIYSPPDWSADAHRAAVRRARERGARIGGHLPRNLPLVEALAAGQQFVAHAEEFLYTHFFKFSDRYAESRIEPAAARIRQAGLSIVPTLVAYRRIVDQVGPGIEELLARPELAHVPPQILERWRPPQNRYRRRFTPEHGLGLAAAFAFQQKLVRAWAAAGIPLALGTDASPDMPFVVPGFSALDELDELARAGLTAPLTIRAATVEAAALIGQARETGAVETGFRADLLLLEGNPLESVGNVRRRVGVMANGRWMTDTELQARLAALRGR